MIKKEFWHTTILCYTVMGGRRRRLSINLRINELDTLVRNCEINIKN